MKSPQHTHDRYLQQAVQILDGKTRIPENRPQRTGPDIASAVNRDSRPAPVLMLHDAVAAMDPRHGEAGLLQRLDYST
jgi:hypothetical protein